MFDTLKKKQTNIVKIFLTTYNVCLEKYVEMKWKTDQTQLTVQQVNEC